MSDDVEAAYFHLCFAADTPSCKLRNRIACASKLGSEDSVVTKSAVSLDKMLVVRASYEPSSSAVRSDPKKGLSAMMPRLFSSADETMCSAQAQCIIPGIRG